MKKTIILIGLVVSLGLLITYSINHNFTHVTSLINLENEKKHHIAGFWEIGPIEIDDDDPTKNWFFTEASYEWCIGSGLINDPYIIENVTIDATGANGITIENSNASFILRNCVIYNAALRGIFLEDVDNGLIYNNTSSENYNGIFIRRANFINISYNHVVDNTHNGIEMGSFCSSCVVSDNVIINNYQNGIVLRQENLYCNITNNTVIGHIYSGIHVQGGSNYNNILFNTVKNNPGNGISIYYSSQNNVSANKVYNNQQFGIVMREGNSNNIISQNILTGCAIGFALPTYSSISSNIIDTTNLQKD